MISALNALNQEDKPEIVVFYSANAPVQYLRQINYPYIEYLLFDLNPSNIFLRKANSAFKKIFQVDVYKKVKYFTRIDCLYPYFEHIDHEFAKVDNKIHWLVDFNNRAFSEHYADKGRAVTDYQERITATNEKVIVSSESLVKELKHYYPNYKCDVRVLRFASSIPILQSEPVQVLKKYQLDKPYFMSPNQFWEHKNHMVILDAVNLIKIKNPGLKFKVLFTGSVEVNRGKGLYLDKLKKKIEAYNIEGYISFLGVMEREEQLILMKEAVALIQPSLYEGWSTLVEEAKAINQFVILSDIPVHREQMSQNVDFFDPSDAKWLADEMVKYLNNPPEIVPIDYRENVFNYGKNILQTFKN
jgi:glycosyltransferase involved in cell wall biosynthesis